MLRLIFIHINKHLHQLGWTAVATRDQDCCHRSERLAQRESLDLSRCIIGTDNLLGQDANAQTRLYKIYNALNGIHYNRLILYDAFCA